MSTFVRFIIVGCCNTCIDMIFTNIGVWWIQPTHTSSLFVISLVAALLATCNSFVWNKNWTFATSSQHANEVSAKIEAVSQSANFSRNWSFAKAPGIIRFFAIAFGAMLINATTFSFVAAALSKRSLLPPLLIINGAKLLGIAAAVSFSFLGQRFCVFNSERSAAFKHAFRFPDPTPLSLHYVWILFFLSLAIRVFMCALSCPQQFLDHFACSIIPSALIAPLVYIYASFFIGSFLPFAIGLTIAFHPRLVEYSYLGIDPISVPLIMTVCIAIQANRVPLFLIGACTLCLLRPEYILLCLPLALWHCRKRFLSISMGALAGSLSSMLYAGTQWLSLSSTTKQFASILPQAVLSPLPLFALLLPLTTKNYPRPFELIALILFSLGYYPWVFSYAHDLMPLLVPLHIFGMLGLYAVTKYVCNKKAHKVFSISVGFLCTLFIGISLFHIFEKAS